MQKKRFRGAFNMGKTGKISLATFKERRYLEIVFPLGFCFSYILEMFLFYIGLSYVDNIGRTILFIIGNVSFTAVCALMFLQTLREMPLSRSGWILGGALMAFFVCCFTGAVVRFGLTDYVVDYISHFVFFSLPAFMGGMIVALRRTEKAFFPTLERFSFLVLPAAVAYFNMIVFSCNPFVNSNYLGILTYMNVTYAFFPFLLAHIIGFAEEREFPIPFGKGRTFRHPQLLRAALVLIYWYDTIGSGTRGACVSVFIFAVVLVVFRLIYRRPAKKALLALLLLLAVFLFCVFVYAPPTMRQGISRWDMFVSGLENGEIVTSVTNERNRGTLYKQAWELFCSSPILGIGTCAYWAQYGIYPHSSVLELLCETGLAGTIPFLALVIYALIKLLRAGKENPALMHFVVFLSAYAFESCTSDTIWNCPALYGALGLALAWRSVKSGKEAGDKATA